MKITKQWLADRLQQPDQQRVLGRALCAIYARQEVQEQNCSGTFLLNGRGFSKPDARIGSKGAEAYQKYGMVPEWNAKIWLAPDKTGFPRICKYAGQLNEIAQRHATPA